MFSQNRIISVIQLLGKVEKSPINHFRALVRHVIHNLYWLQNIEDIPLISASTLKIKEKISRLASKKVTADKFLTIKEIKILRKNTEFRTEMEKRHLYRIIGNLKCFKRYPDEIKKKLVGVTYFEYFGPGRVLLREDHEPEALYFIIKGEILVTKKIFDEVTLTWEDNEIGKLDSGKMFGEIALLYDITRTATVTTTAPCELLVLKKNDFDQILRKTLMTDWIEIRHAMEDFSYFNKWTNIAIRECCMVSKIENYPPNKVILGDGILKRTPMTYFIIHGECRVIQDLQIQVFDDKGLKSYKLVKKREKFVKEQTDEYKSKLFRRLHSINFNEETIKDELQLLNTKMEDEETDDYDYDEEEELEIHTNIQREIENLFRRHTMFDKTSFAYSAATKHVKQMRKEMVIAKCKKLIDDHLARLNFQTSRTRMSTMPILSLDTRLIFMEICTLRKKATFSDGLFLHHKRIVTKIPTKCLLIPTNFLNMHDKEKIWPRLNTFVEMVFPSDEELLRKYVTELKWKEYKEKLISDLIRVKKTNTVTTHDIPYSLRLLN